jgi:CDP-paratose 2-epimerase
MHLLITGGAGFIGSNAADYFLRRGWTVTIFDNCSRLGADQNLEWLRSHHRFHFIRGDMRDAAQVADAVRGGDLDLVLHLAAQASVVRSVIDPHMDFEVNALGTLNLLEAVRLHRPEALLINASSNKVYGPLDDLAIVEEADRYAYRDFPFGIDETRPLDFHSPYGCSKGAADQYVRDYARIYGMRTVTMRQSCVYGPRQFGIEDHGWVAWFIIAAVLGRPLTLYGTGKQVRDVLFVEDLVACYEAAYRQRDRMTGSCYNIGGGAGQVLSLLRLLDLLEAEVGRPVSRRMAPVREGDQRIFVCDIRKAERELGWTPKVGVEEGVRRLLRWVTENQTLFT